MNLIKNEWIFKNQKMPKDADFYETLSEMRKAENLAKNDNLHSYYGSEEEKFHNPFIFKDMKKVVNRIQEALIKGEKILIHGDYDVDGITALAIWLLFLKEIDYPSTYYIPNRLEEGYGISDTSIDFILEKDINLLITVDCGITAVEEIERLKKHKIDVILTDHHAKGSILPRPYALINPCLDTEDYPFKRLCGATVALKCIQALCENLPFYLLQPLAQKYKQKGVDLSKDFSEEKFVRTYWKKYMSLAAMGTIADVMPLIGENRFLIKKGFLKGEADVFPVIEALASFSSVSSNPDDDAYFSVNDIAYQVAPRINAAGRLGLADIALHLFLSENISEAKNWLKELENLNDQRKNFELEGNSVIVDYLSRGTHHFKTSIIVLASEKLHPGILGIIAARLCQKYLKPVIVLAKSEKDKDGKILLKGSARSFGKVNILNLIRQAGENILVQVGGHYHAAGLSIYEDDLELFKENLERLASTEEIDVFNRPILCIDYVLPSRFVQLKFANLLEKFSPYGESQEEFLFCSYSMQVVAFKVVGKDGKHLQLKLDFGPIKQLNAIYFGKGYLADILEVGQYIDIVYHLRINVWNNQRQLQIFIVDLRLKDICYLPTSISEEEQDFLYLETSCLLNRKNYFLQLFLEDKNKMKYFSKFYLLLRQICGNGDDFSLVEVEELAHFHAGLWKIPYSLELTKVCLDIFSESKLFEIGSWSKSPDIILLRLNNGLQNNKINLSQSTSFAKLVRELDNLWNI